MHTGGDKDRGVMAPDVSAEHEESFFYENNTQWNIPLLQRWSISHITTCCCFSLTSNLPGESASRRPRCLPSERGLCEVWEVSVESATREAAGGGFPIWIAHPRFY